MVVGDDESIWADDEPGSRIWVEFVTVTAESETAEYDGGLSSCFIKIGFFGDQWFRGWEGNCCGSSAELGLQVFVVLWDCAGGDLFAVCVEGGHNCFVVDDEFFGLSENEGGEESCHCGSYLL